MFLCGWKPAVRTKIWWNSPYIVHFIGAVLYNYLQIHWRE